MYAYKKLYKKLEDKRCNYFKTIFAHLVNNETCKALSTENCFEIIDSASTPFRLKLKEAMHIIWKKASLNKQEKHVSISITV